jgi:hypothetical protein
MVEVRVPWCRWWRVRDRWFWWWLEYRGDDVGVVETGGCGGGFGTVVTVLTW